jgi:hypothetical protein
MSEFVVRDRDQVRRVAIDRQMTIGRSRDNSLVLLSPIASRRHAQVWQQGGRVIIEDLGSTYGTLVNGMRVTSPRFLYHNDVITIGDAQLTFVEDYRLVPTVHPQAWSPPAGPQAGQTPRAPAPRLMASQLYCPNCSAPNHIQALYCQNCGYPLDWGDRYEQGWERQMAHNWQSNPTTPVEPVVPRPFPVTSSEVQAGSSRGIWILILILAIMTVILLITVAVLVIYTIG